MSGLLQIEHLPSIHAVALSRNGNHIAVGGSAASTPVTVWNTEIGQKVVNCEGITGLVILLAFGANSTRLAAINEQGNLIVWEIPSGKIVQEKRSDDPNLSYTLIFLDNTDEPATFSRLKWHLHQNLSPSPDGRLIAESNFNDFVAAYAQISIKHVGMDEAVVSLKAARYEPATSGPLSLRWSADSQALGMCSFDWCGIWLVNENKFYIHPLPVKNAVRDFAVLPGNHQLVCAVSEPTLTVLQMPREPALTRWQAYKQRRDAEPSKQIANPKHDWQWPVEGMWGHDGVHTQTDNEILWYSHLHNPHAGGGASIQTYEDFMENGPQFNPPEAKILDELYDAVKVLMQRK